ncbi:MAG: M1 family aminopeptidase [Gallionella sp.]
MHRTVSILLMFYAMSCHSQVLPHHRLKIRLLPETHTLEGVDRVSIPPGSPRNLIFSMNGALQPHSPDAKLVANEVVEPGGLTRFRITLPKGRASFTVIYSGDIFQPPRQDAREARVFETSSGIIAVDGAVLSGSSGWFPMVEDAAGAGMFTFALDVTVPANWEAVSGGRMTGRKLLDKNAGVQIAWAETHPQQDIHLIAAPFKVYRQVESGVEELVYLRSEDPALAQRYLEATATYLGYYRKLIGEYPYAKFALVENFWETGYGMPSFTLLGSQVIRLPFIINTSYPHEILHNWWGNGVYVDYQSGNWSEGLTAYLADHLLQEEQGSAVEYRRGTLQKYTDYVNLGRDFPLSEFVSRHSASSEAVGYGKALMLFHMLRRRMDDDKFRAALKSLYADFKFKRAGFRDLETTFSRVAGEDLKPFFRQWVQRQGAPELRLDFANVKQSASGYDLNIGIEQTQAGDAFTLDLPLAVTFAGEHKASLVRVTMNTKNAEWNLHLNQKPLRVDVDPEFDVFRRLDSSEVPPAMSQIFGAARLLLVLPRAAPVELKSQYLAVANKWRQQAGDQAEVVWDDQISDIPNRGSVWLFGWENRWREQLRVPLQEFNTVMSADTVSLGKSVYLQSTNPLALTAHIGDTPVGWLAVPKAEMMPILARKLPHYSKYSYVIFEGDELRNLEKGMWPVTRSALQMMVHDERGEFTDTMRGELPLRNGLLVR